MTRRHTKWILPALAILVACTSDNPGDTDSPDVVARHRDGTITIADVDTALVKLPPERRPGPGELDLPWLEEFVTELLVDRLLGEQGELTGVQTDPRLKRTLAELERNLAWEDYLNHALGPFDLPSETDVRAEFERRRTESTRSERRLVRNIFVRRRGDEANAQVTERVERVRARIEAGESFETLAGEVSDSETSVRGGMIGWVERPALSPAVAELVFALGEKEVSAPVLSPDGAHLFYVEAIARAKTPTFEDAAVGLRQDLARANREEAISELVASLPDPEVGLFVASESELSSLLEAGDSSALVLRAGDYEMTLGALLAGVRTRAETHVSPADHLEYLARREKVYYEARSEGILEHSHIQDTLARAAEADSGRLLREQALRRMIDAEPARIQSFYQDQMGRFSSPLQLELERLTIPVSDDELKAAMLALQDRYREQGPVGTDLSELADEFSGQVESLGWLSAKTLANDKALAGMITDLGIGETSSPFRAPTGIQMVQVVGRREPEAQALATILDEVREAYLAEQGQALYREWRAQFLGEAEAEILTGGLERVREAALPRLGPVDGAPPDVDPGGP